jgi:hypothetical protein
MIKLFFVFAVLYQFKFYLQIETFELIIFSFFDNFQ